MYVGSLRSNVPTGFSVQPVQPPTARARASASLGRRPPRWASVLAVVVVVLLLGLFVAFTQPLVPPNDRCVFNLVRLEMADRSRSSVSFNVTFLQPKRPIPLSEYSADAFLDDATIGRISPLKGQSTSGSLSFVDSDNDGNLTIGDWFRIATPQDGYYVLAIQWQECPLGWASLWVAPVLSLSNATVEGTSATVTVLGSQPAHPLSEYAAIAKRNYETYATLPSLDRGTDPNITFVDADQDGLLTPGDGFHVRSPEAGFYEIVVSWRQGGFAQQGWQIVPAVTLRPVTFDQGNGSAILTVDQVSPEDTLNSFAAGAYRSVNIGWLSLLRDGAADAELSFSDADRSGTLSAGDRFLIHSLDLGHYVFRLSWHGWWVAVSEWTI